MFDPSLFLNSASSGILSLQLLEIQQNAISPPNVIVPQTQCTTFIGDNINLKNFQSSLTHIQRLPASKIEVEKKPTLQRTIHSNKVRNSIQNDSEKQIVINRNSYNSQYQRTSNVVSVKAEINLQCQMNSDKTSSKKRFSLQKSNGKGFAFNDLTKNSNYKMGIFSPNNPIQSVSSQTQTARHIDNDELLNRKRDVMRSRKNSINSSFQLIQKPGEYKICELNYEYIREIRQSIKNPSRSIQTTQRDEKGETSYKSQLSKEVYLNHVFDRLEGIIDQIEVQNFSSTENLPSMLKMVQEKHKTQFVINRVVEVEIHQQKQPTNQNQQLHPFLQIESNFEKRQKHLLQISAQNYQQEKIVKQNKQGLEPVLQLEQHQSSLQRIDQEGNNDSHVEQLCESSSRMKYTDYKAQILNQLALTDRKTYRTCSETRRTLFTKNLSSKYITITLNDNQKACKEDLSDMNRRGGISICRESRIRSLSRRSASGSKVEKQRQQKQIGSKNSISRRKSQKGILVTHSNQKKHSKTKKSDQRKIFITKTNIPVRQLREYNVNCLKSSHYSLQQPAYRKSNIQHQKQNQILQKQEMQNQSRDQPTKNQPGQINDLPFIKNECAQVQASRCNHHIKTSRKKNQRCAASKSHITSKTLNPNTFFQERRIFKNN